ncbi:hypothetical protein C8F04DRAFT_1271486 [Mycena alexandri]|uniref:Uncharacterized protein n=1 Tax=Mycena alexandri TaxID=1745969 RepID=A0AAD6WTU7_9AGAR|nr:hypothetical protein C8F04DRAFT_1271486 [Mycena alexandri]
MDLITFHCSYLSYSPSIIRGENLVKYILAQVAPPSVGPTKVKLDQSFNQGGLQAKRARSVVGEQDDRGGSKRQRQEASPETALQENNRVLMKLWFAIRKPGDEKATTSMTFFATHLIATDQRTRADFYTVEYNPDDGWWHQIRPGMTPVLATDEDKDRYERAKDLLALHGAK